MLKSKCILAEKAPEDGKRVSVMSRHTLSDWKTPDERITPDIFDDHKPIFAAPPKLVGAYYRKEIDFDQYAVLYKEHLQKVEKELVDILIYPAISENVTVMCIEDTPCQCHRRILLEHCKELAETLSISDFVIDVK